MTGLYVLEFGVLFLSVLIGLALALSGEEFVVLYLQGNDQQASYQDVWNPDTALGLGGSMGRT